MRRQVTFRNFSEKKHNEWINFATKKKFGIIKSNCYSGIHPHDAKSWDEDGATETLSSITELASSSECVAIGECGLDFNRNFSPPDIQLEVFEEQIKLACRLQKPLFLHERDAHEDMVRLLQKYKDQGNLPSCVIHCFCGTVEQAIKYLSMGCYIGLTGKEAIPEKDMLKNMT